MSTKNLLSLMIAASLSLFTLTACQAGSGSESTDGAPEAKAAAAAFKTFKHPEVKFSMEYPANWEIEEVNAPFLMKMRDPSGRANINGSFEKAPGMTHLTFAKAVEDLYNAKPEVNYKKISENEITIDGVKAIKRIHNLGETGKPAQQMSIYFVKDDVGYSVNCTTLPAWFANFEPIFNKSIDSVKL